MKKKFEKVYQFKIVLEDIKPMIWRRIQVPETYTFWDLHVAIQNAMGWYDCHLHEFEMRDPFTKIEVRIVTPHEEVESYHGEKIVFEQSAKISDWFTLENNSADYTYDFGDGWDHKIKLEKIVPREKKTKYPKCIAGKNACPPEDCGGIWGFKEFVFAMQHPNHMRHKELFNWYGGPFDPEKFNPEEVFFDNPKKRWKQRMQY